MGKTKPTKTIPAETIKKIEAVPDNLKAARSILDLYKEMQGAAYDYEEPQDEDELITMASEISDKVQKNPHPLATPIRNLAAAYLSE